MTGMRSVRPRVAHEARLTRHTTASFAEKCSQVVALKSQNGRRNAADTQLQFTYLDSFSNIWFYNE
jgi:hypothetical protein